MNILYIEHYAGSPEMGMEFRPYYLSREWVKMGHSVRMVAGNYSHLRAKNPDIKEDFEEESIDGITYNWINTGYYEGNGVKRALSMFRFVGKLWKNARKISKEWKPDVIITSSTYPIDTFAGQRIKKFSGAMLIHEIHDMWPTTLIELGGMKKTNPFVVLMQIGENSFCRKSDKVVSVLCDAKDYLVQHGMAPEKFVAISNGIVPEEWEDSLPLPEQHKALLDRLHEENKFVICFFGSITRSYAIDYLIRAIQKMNDPRVAFVVIGEGNQKEELKKMSVPNVYFMDKIPKRSIPSLMKDIDCCYVGALKNDMFRFGIGMNKLFDSMMSGKPVLYAVEAPNNYIVDYSCGVSVDAEDEDALIRGIEKLLSMTEEERHAMGANGRKAVMENFTYKELAKRFDDVFRKE